MRVLRDKFQSHPVETDRWLWPWALIFDEYAIRPGISLEAPAPLLRRLPFPPIDDLCSPNWTIELTVKVKPVVRLHKRLWECLIRLRELPRWRINERLPIGVPRFRVERILPQVFWVVNLQRGGVREVGVVCGGGHGFKVWGAPETPA